VDESDLRTTRGGVTRTSSLTSPPQRIDVLFVTDFPGFIPLSKRCQPCNWTEPRLAPGGLGLRSLSLDKGVRIVLWQDAALGVDGERKLPAERQLRLVTSADAGLGAGDRESRDPRVRQVLVVDDERSIRFLCGVNLKLAGFEVTEAATGAHALQLAKSRQFDLVLLDVMLPDIGGHEVARDLAADERTAGLPIVFVSARAARDDIRLGFELGAID